LIHETLDEQAGRPEKLLGEHDQRALYLGMKFIEEWVLSGP
jgi:hypothetical protein